MSVTITANSGRVAISDKQVIDYTQDELDVIFDSLPEATSVDLEGPYKGKLFAIMGLQLLPRFLNRWLTRVIQTPLIMWAGKGFYGADGANLWFTTNKKLTFGYYNISVRDALDSKGKVISLDYDVDKNIGLLKPIMGEVRKAGENYYLARMMWRTKKSNSCVLYFSLKK